MTRLLRKTREWLDGSDGRDYLVTACYTLDWFLTSDNLLHCERLNITFETQGMPVAQTGANAFMIIPTGVRLFRHEYAGVSAEKHDAMTRLSRVMLSR